MKRRIRVVLIVGLVFSLFASSTAFAVTKTRLQSTAETCIGITTAVDGGKQDLDETSLHGYVISYQTSTGTATLVGRMFTKGVIFTYSRDYAVVSPGGYDYLYWANPNGDTGTYWSEVQAAAGNHNGECVVYQ